MVARCETVGKYVLPVFRSLVAKELITAYNMTQVEAAEKLGTTQAAISQYINSKRAFKGAEKYAEFIPKLQAMAKDTASRLVKSELQPDQIVVDFCKLCPALCGKQQNQTDEDFSI